MRDARVYAQRATAVDDPAESAAVERGDRGFAPLVRLLRSRESVDVRAVLRLVPGSTEADLLRIEAGVERATVDWVRAYSMATSATFSMLFDVWDREAPDAASRMTVAEASAMCRRLMETPKGVVCPCCDAKVVARKRTLNEAVASFVSWLARHYAGTPLDALRWVDLHPKLSRGGDYAKARYWGLASRVPGEEPLWIPTEEGRRWAFGMTKVHRQAVLFRGAVLRFAGPKVAITEVASGEEINRGVSMTPSLPGFDS